MRPCSSSSCAIGATSLHLIGSMRLCVLVQALYPQARYFLKHPWYLLTRQKTIDAHGFEVFGHASHLIACCWPCSSLRNLQTARPFPCRAQATDHHLGQVQRAARSAQDRKRKRATDDSMDWRWHDVPAGTPRKDSSDDTKRRRGV